MVAISNFGDVGAFHEKFGLARSYPYAGEPTPHAADLDLMDFRSKFLEEELNEFRAALGTQDHAGMFDALIDLVYVAMGTAHLLGYPWQSGWRLVQAANMAKIKATTASESTRGYQFDIVKPPGWQAPNIAGLLQSFGYEVEISD